MVLRVPDASRDGANAVTPRKPAEREADEIHQPVPPHGERAEVDRDGVELRVDQHSEGGGGYAKIGALIIRVLTPESSHAGQST